MSVNVYTSDAGVKTVDKVVVPSDANGGTTDLYTLEDAREGYSPDGDVTHEAPTIEVLADGTIHAEADGEEDTIPLPETDISLDGTTLKAVMEGVTSPLATASLSSLGLQTAGSGGGSGSTGGVIDIDFTALMTYLGTVTGKGAVEYQDLVKDSNCSYEISSGTTITITLNTAFTAAPNWMLIVDRTQIAQAQPVASMFLIGIVGNGTKNALVWGSSQQLKALHSTSANQAITASTIKMFSDQTYLKNSLDAGHDVRVWAFFTAS